MSLFDSFTVPKWQHSDPQVRKQAIEQLVDEEVLLELVKSDPAATVQSAALSRINNPATLDALIETLPPALQPQARSQRLRQLLPQADHLAQIDDDTTLLRIASLTDRDELAAAAVAQISDIEIRMQAAKHHPLAKVRLTAARGVRDIGLLHELMLAARDHDRGVYRHCKKLVDEHNALQQLEAEQQEKIRQLGQQIKELAESFNSLDQQSHYQGLKLQWQAINPLASPGQRESVQGDFALCAGRLASLSASKAAAEQTEAERVNASQEFQAVIDELEQIDGGAETPQDNAAIQQLNLALDGLQQRWQAAMAVTKAAPGQEASFKDLMERWRLLLITARGLPGKTVRLEKTVQEAAGIDSTDYDAVQHLLEGSGKLIASLPWPERKAHGLPAALARMHEARARLLSQFSTLGKNQQKYIAQTQACIETLRTRLDENHTREADRSLSAVRRALKSLPPPQRQKFEQILKPLAARLNEAHDWQGFAIEPKKLELCASMAALIGSQEDVEMLALKIQSLQDEWKQIGALPHAHEQALWLQFKAAADEAWKPCKAAFSAQAKLQRENFKRRMELVKQLADYDARMAWPGDADSTALAVVTEPAPAPDWHKVQKTLDAARAAFSTIKPVNPRDERNSQKAFREICDRIYAHIKEEYERNIARKTELAAQAEILTTATDLPAAIEAAKKLQREWKMVGLTPVAADRKLWKAFRAACDTVFTRLDEQRVQNQAGMEAQVKQAGDLRDQARGLLAAQGDEQVLNLHKALAELKQQFTQLALPPAVQQRLLKDFQAMEHQARDSAAAFRSRQEAASWNHLQKKMRACALKHSDAGQATSLWQNAGALPRDIDASALEAWWQQGPPGGTDEQMREACIALEVLAEVESPAADKKARMNYQMRRLAAGMRGEKPVPGQARLDCINQFIALRPSNDWLDRFFSALNASQK